MTRPAMVFNAAENVVFIDNKDVHLETADDIEAYFDFVLQFCKRNCDGKKTYVITCYDGFSLNLRENDPFRERLAPVAATIAIAIVRYGGDPLQRTAARVRSMKLQSSSRIYNTREQALEAVRVLRAEEAARGGLSQT